MEIVKKFKERPISISGILNKLDVSRSGYNAWLTRKLTENQLHKEKIKEIHINSKQNYGSPKITMELVNEGESISQRTVSKYMQEMGIKAQWIKPYTITKLDSDFSTKLKNILNEEFNPIKPNSVWCSDITYIWTIDGFVYLTSIMDLFSRKIIAWKLSKTMEVENVVAVINKAKAVRELDEPLIIHTDRGKQYVSNAYIEATEGLNLSYSKKAYPWDNACIESFHALIKREWLNRFRIRDYEEAYRLVFEFIETFYNTVRIHSHCEYMSPNNYEKLYKIKKEKDVAS